MKESPREILKRLGSQRAADSAFQDPHRLARRFMHRLRLGLIDVADLERRGRLTERRQERLDHER